MTFEQLPSRQENFQFEPEKPQPQVENLDDILALRKKHERAEAEEKNLKRRAHKTHGGLK